MHLRIQHQPWLQRTTALQICRPASQGTIRNTSHHHAQVNTILYDLQQEGQVVRTQRPGGQPLWYRV